MYNYLPVRPDTDNGYNKYNCIQQPVDGNDYRFRCNIHDILQIKEKQDFTAKTCVSGAQLALHFWQLNIL